MTLAPGIRLGSYEVLAPIGAGGMGEVYRARDTRLHRDVAIKILPELFAADPDRLMRFEREAKTLAALNHPNIAHVYGVEESPGGRALVMELVDGDDLAQQLARGPLPVDQALAVARDVAAALEAAHEAGIVHRDLKPANIKVRPDGTVKVLDFGLAKVAEPLGAGTDAAHSPTFTSPALTQMGVVLGTAAYMAPEQARGKAVDKRADIWAFGCVLYELLTGRVAFAGETMTDTLAAIMTRDLDLDALPSGTPPAVRRLLARCLERDPKQRLRDIGEARIALEAAERGGPEPVAVDRPGVARWRAMVPWAIAAIAILVAVAFTWLRPVPAAMDLPALSYRLALPGLSMARNALPVVSPDGRRIAFVSGRRLWVRDLDQLEPRQVSGVEDPQFPFWSPDGGQVAYLHSGTLWRVPVEGGRPVVIAAMRANLGARTPGGVWRPDGSIVFATSATGSGLLVVAEQGGEMRTLYEQDAATEYDLHRPSLLPDGDSLLFVVDRVDMGPDTIGVLSRGRRSDVLTIEGEVLDSPVYSPTGHIVYHRETTAPGVWAVPFSLERLETTGDPFLIAADGSWPAVAASGALIYADEEFTGLMRLSWVDRQGTVTPAFPETFPAISSPRLSADGHRLAAIVRTDHNQSAAVVFDLRRQTRAIIERSVAGGAQVSWLGNERVAIAGTTGPSGAAERLLVRHVDGTGRDEIEGRGFEPDGARDGSALVFVQVAPGTGADLWHLASGMPRLLLGTPNHERHPALSPDASWLAYTSNQTGQLEVFLRPYPQDGPNVPVSSGGGQAPRWSPAGDRIYYRLGTAGADGHTGLMEVAVERRDGELTLGSPRPVTIPGGIETYPGGFDVAPDGSRLIVVQNAGGGADPSLIVLQNWVAQVRP
jgi:eukaryotic-like serine/threonine-protein kinase